MAWVLNDDLKKYAHMAFLPGCPTQSFISKLGMLELRAECLG